MTKKKAISYGVSLALSVCFALVYYTFTTPLGPSIGSDNAMYMTMGAALAEGYAPYTQIFDHKGPLLFILQAVPQILSGGYSTLAVFVQQVIFLFACLCLLAAIGRELGVWQLLPQMVYLALIAANVGGGNLSEEYTNLFTLAGILMILWTFADGLPKTTKGLFVRAVLLGAMNMLCFLTRANNVLVLCAMTLAIAAWMLLARRMDLLVSCMGGFAAGLVLYALPMVIWMVYHDALAESFYGAIIHNMMYAETNGRSRLAMLFFDTYGHSAILMAALTLLGAASYARRNPGLALSMVAGAAAGGFSAFISHKFYAHYLLLGAPLAAVGAAKAFAAVRMQWSKLYRVLCAAAAVVCVCYLCMQGVETNRVRLSEYESMDEFTEHARALYALVPEEDRDRFMAYRVEPKWYVAAEALPCMRFYFLQEILADADPAVMDEIVAEFEANPPKWLVIYYNRAFSPPYDVRVREIFETCYEFVEARGEYQLLRLKETP